MAKDRYERRHRRTIHNSEVQALMANADFDNTPSLAASMGLLRCIHLSPFPCPQCLANRRTQEAANGRKITEREFEERYVDHRIGEIDPETGWPPRR